MLFPMKIYLFYDKLSTNLHWYLDLGKSAFLTFLRHNMFWYLQSILRELCLAVEFSF